MHPLAYCGVQGDDIDELFGFAGEEDELRFDSAELEQIEMLERYRQNLVAASTAGAAPPPTASNPSDYRKGSSPNPSEDLTEGTTDGSYASLQGLDKVGPDHRRAKVLRVVRRLTCLTWSMLTDCAGGEHEANCRV